MLVSSGSGMLTVAGGYDPCNRVELVVFPTLQPYIFKESHELFDGPFIHIDPLVPSSAR